MIIRNVRHDWLDKAGYFINYTGQSGSAKILRGNNNGMHLIGSKKLNITNLSEDVQVFVTRTNNGVFTTGYNADTHAKCFWRANTVNPGFLVPMTINW